MYLNIYKKKGQSIILNCSHEKGKDSLSEEHYNQNISSIKKSSLEKQRFQLLLKDKKNKTTSETSNSWSNYQSSKSVLEATKAQLKAAEIANEGITLEYDSGNTRTTLEVIQSRSLLLESRIAFAQAKRDFMVSKFELALQLGTLSQKTVK